MATATQTDYNKQASDFLKKYAIKFSQTYIGENCPPFCDDPRHIHGSQYRIVMRNTNGRSLQFMFWNSFEDARKHKSPNAYDVLSCIGSDAFCPDTFEDFCAEYGYEEDSRKAFATFKRCVNFAERINRFFTAEQIEDLSEIA